MTHAIGIDLGTTNSCVAFVENNEPVVVPNAEGSRTTPSVVALMEDGERRVGTVAKRQAVSNPENTVFAIKRLMGLPFESETSKKHAAAVPYRMVPAPNGDAWVQIGGRDYAPPEISAMVLRSMKETAEAFVGSKITEAVVTVPAYFNDAQRQATKDAGKIAGLSVKRIINEPTAAALAYGFEKKGNARVAVYDLGGGTFDISILEIASGVFSVRSTNGDTHLGGEDFDNAIVGMLADEFLQAHGIDLRKDRVALQRLKEQAEKAKHELSSSLETEVNLPFIATDDKGPKHLVRTVKRSELEILVGALVEQTFGPCQKALDDAGLKVSDVDQILLVGGQTRMPLVQKRVTEFFGKEPNKSVNPDEVVAIGAALQAAALSGVVEEVLLLDVTPLSLGVETAGGIFTRLIERNTTIPTQKSEIFTTSVDNQGFVPIHVLQGERDMAADNKSLARFELTPIPPAPRGIPQIEVTFDLDADGIVSVRARDLGTGKEQSVRVVASSGLNKDQIDRIMVEAERSRQSDSQRKEIAELRNNAEALMYSAERAMTECADAVAPELVAAVRADIVGLRGLVDSAADPTVIRDGLKKLEMSAYKIAELLYKTDDK